MNKIYKETYEAPTVELIKVSQSLDILTGGFSGGDGGIEDPDDGGNGGFVDDGFNWGDGRGYWGGKR